MPPVRSKRVALKMAGLVLVSGLSMAGWKISADAQTAAQGDANPVQTSSAKTGSDQPAATLSVDVKVVNVLATVRDKHGKIVNTLSKNDFTLTEDGRPQSIRYFAKDNDLPLTIGLMVDTSLSQRRVIDQERSASYSFMDQIVRENKDKAFVIHFDREVELLQDLTSSHEKLDAAIRQLQTPQLQRTSGGGTQDPDAQTGSDSRGRGGHGGTLLYDAIYLGSNELMKKQPGRKALIVLSDGVDRGSKETLENAIEAAQRADTVVYSVLFKDDEGGGEHRGGFGGPRIGMGIPGMGGPGMGGGGMGRRGGGRRPEQPRVDGKKILERISHETGGRLFEATKKDPIDKIYAQIEEELRNQYNLGYAPDRPSDVASSYHKIRLMAKQKDLVVQAREGYYVDR
jgi:VWFA-related protein